jgi:hypothetical protein
MPALCSVDRDFVMVVERALATVSVTPTFIPDPARPNTHYHVMVEDDEVDQAHAALEMVGTFIPEEVRP